MVTYSPARADEAPKVRRITFNIIPSNATVRQGTLESLHFLGVQGEEIPVTFAGEYAKGDRPMTFWLSVPQWFGREYPNWDSTAGPLTGGNLTGFRLQASFDETKAKVIPANGQPYKLPLPLGVAVQAWTLGHPVPTFLGLTLTGLLVFVVTRWRSLVGRFSIKTTESDPNTVGEYRLNKMIGEGGMGEVWAASTTSQLNCALKFIKREFATDPEYKARFEREIKVCQPLDHPHLLKLYGYGVANDGRLFLVSELLFGRTLKEAIFSGDFDPPQLATKVLEQIGDVLQYLHDHKLVHRDVKPDNIFVCENGDLKLMDLGLIGGDMTLITQKGAVMGTPAYMPPEQADSIGVCSASDQYALGIVLYEILVGQRPFIADNSMLLLYQHMHVAPPKPSEQQPRIPPEVEKAILRMLMKKPDQRFGSVKEAQEALESLGFSTWKDTSEETQAARVKDIPK